MCSSSDWGLQPTLHPICKPCEISPFTCTHIFVFVIVHVDNHKTHILFNSLDMHSEHRTESKRVVLLINSLCPLFFHLAVRFFISSPYLSSLSLCFLDPQPHLLLRYIHEHKNRQACKDFPQPFKQETVSRKIRFIRQIQTDGWIRQIRSRLADTHQYA